jgi:hypothetical protein
LAPIPAILQQGRSSFQMDTEPFEVHTLYLETKK